MKRSIQIITSILLFSCIFAGVCALLPAAKVAKNLADQACQQYFGETYGLSVEDVARFYCDNEEILDVFLACEGKENCLEAAGPEAAGMMGLSVK